MDHEKSNLIEACVYICHLFDRNAFVLTCAVLSNIPETVEEETSTVNKYGCLHINFNHLLAHNFILCLIMPPVQVFVLFSETDQFSFAPAILKL